MRLSEIRSETDEIAVQFATGDLLVTYRPNIFTADKADAMQEAARDPKKQTDSVFMMASDVLVRWDLEDDKGGIIPLDDIKVLRAEVPMQVFGRIFVAIQEKQNPNVGKAAATS